MTPPRAFSIRQPYAWAICYGYKPVENRDWKATNPNRRYRGPVLIHAGLREERDDVYGVLRQVAHETGQDMTSLKSHYKQNAYRGGLVGGATIVDLVTDHPSEWFHGPLGLVIEDARPIPPIALKGVLGFFRVPDEILEQIANLGADP